LTAQARSKLSGYRLQSATPFGEAPLTNVPSPPQLEFVFGADVKVDQALSVGDVGKGTRRFVPIAGGEASGPKLKGKVLPGGGDWQTIRDDGVAELEARYTVETDDGALIFVRNYGLRHGPPEIIAALAAGKAVDHGSYYFRGATFFETSAGQYVWLTRQIIVCVGEREPARVSLKFYQVL
jgi:Protein of unknown function (DUF3237)